MNKVCVMYFTNSVYKKSPNKMIKVTTMRNFYNFVNQYTNFETRRKLNTIVGSRCKVTLTISLINPLLLSWKND